MSAVKWLRGWGAVLCLVPMIVIGLIGYGEVKADVKANAESIRRIEESVKDALRDFRLENREDHKAILDLIEKLRDKLEAK